MLQQENDEFEEEIFQPSQVSVMFFHFDGRYFAQ